MNFKFHTVATATVALVLLIDIATGQGPPLLQAYLAQQQAYPPTVQLPPNNKVVYLPRGEFDSPNNENEYDKAREYKKDLGKGDRVIVNPIGGPIKDQVLYGEAPQATGYKKDEGSYGGVIGEPANSTPVPGYLDSITNMWNTIRAMGRKKRSINIKPVQF